MPDLDEVRENQPEVDAAWQISMKVIILERNTQGKKLAFPTVLSLSLVSRAALLEMTPVEGRTSVVTEGEGAGFASRWISQSSLSLCPVFGIF